MKNTDKGFVFYVYLNFLLDLQVGCNMMDKLLPFLLFLCSVVSTINSESITYPSNQPLLIKCSIGENIHISKIRIYEKETKCLRRICNTTEIKENIINSCDGKHSCSLIDDKSDECVKDYGFVDLSYSCYDRTFFCDFEESSCNCAYGYLYHGHWSGWTNNWHYVHNHAYHWQIKKGNAHMINTKDHTKLTGGGYYAFADASDGRQNDVAYLKSPLITPHENQCLSFLYFGHSYRQQRLSVVQQEYGRNKRYLLKTFFRETIGWHHKKLPLKSTHRHFYVVFKAVRGYSNYNDGHISFDDISISNTRCNGAVSHNEPCLSVSKPIRLDKCPIRNIDFQTLQPIFEPEFKNCASIYSNLRDDLVDQCKSTKNSLCSLNIEEALYSRPECFMLNRIKVEYTCAAFTSSSSSVSFTSSHRPEVHVAVTSSSTKVKLNHSYVSRALTGTPRSVKLTRSYIPDEHTTTTDNSSSVSVNSSSSHVSRENEDEFASIIGVSIGLAVLVLCLFILSACIIRHRKTKRDSLLTDNNMRMNDYNGDLNETVRTSVMSVENRTYSIEQDMIPNHTYTNVAINGTSTEGNIYINATDAGTRKQKKITPTNKTKQLKLEQNYAILDPEETGYDRSEDMVEYELASQICKDEVNNEEDTNDVYVRSNDGTYDTSANIRHVTENDENVYNQTVDDVYNTGCHERKLSKDDTYDYFKA